MHHLAVPALAAALLGLAAAPTAAQAPMFTPGSVRVGGAPYPYQLLQPPARDRSSPLPLVVYLHGAGERGSDNEAQRKWLPDVLARPEWMQRHPCFVLAVQCPKDQQWVAVPWGEPHGAPFPDQPSPAMQAVLTAMDEVLASHPIDRGRVYLTGLSMGGYGSWDLAAREPQRFAAMLAVCGGGDARWAHRFVGLPVCVYHGQDDRTVPVGRSQAMVAALRQLGLAVDYRELPGVGHDAWRQAYGERGALDWLFQQDQRQQQRGAWSQAPLVPAPDRTLLRSGEFRLGTGARCIAGPGAEAAVEAFAAAVRLHAGRELLTAAGPAADGDVEFRIDPAAGAAIVVEAGAVLRIAAVDPASLWRGAFAAWQLLQARPGFRCSAGRWAYAAAPGEVWLDIGATVGIWSPAQQRELAGMAAWHGVRGIVGAAFTAPSVATLAALGVVSGPGGGPPPGAATVDVVAPTGASTSFADLLALPPAGVVGGRPLLLALPALPPDQVLTALRTHLPAVVEREHHRTRPIHVGGFLARLGCLLRAAHG